MNKWAGLWDYSMDRNLTTTRQQNSSFSSTTRLLTTPGRTSRPSTYAKPPSFYSVVYEMDVWIQIHGLNTRGKADRNVKRVTDDTGNNSVTSPCSPSRPNRFRVLLLSPKSLGYVDEPCIYCVAIFAGHDI